MELIQGDCLEVMKSIPNGSIDAIITALENLNLIDNN